MTETLTAVFRAVDQITPVLRNIEGTTSSIQGTIRSAMSSIGTAIVAGFSVAAVTAAINRFTDFTGKLTDLSTRTGIGTTALQTLQMAFERSGVSIDTVTRAIAMMSQNLVSGDRGAVRALEALGFRVDDLLRMAPDQAFIRVADAVGQIENPMQRVAVAAEIGGKAMVDALAGMDGQLQETIASFERMGVVMDEDLVRAGDDLGDALTVLQTVGGGLLARVIQPLLPAMTAAANAAAWFGGVAMPTLQWAFEQLLIVGMRSLLWFYEFLEGVAEAGSEIPVLGRALNMTSDAVQDFRNRAEFVRNALDGMTVETNRSRGAVNELRPAIQNYGAATEEAQRKQEQFNQKLRDLNGTGAVAAGYEIVTMLGAVDGPLNVIPSKLLSMANNLRAAAEGARVLGDERLAEQFELLARTLDPLVQFQQRYNVTIGEYIPLADTAEASTDAMWEQFYRLSGQVESFGPLLQNTLNPQFVEFKRAVDDVTPAEALAKDATIALDGSLRNLSQAFATLNQASGGDPDSVTAALGRFVGSLALAEEAGTTFRNGLDQIGQGGSFRNIVGGMANVVSGAASFISALQEAGNTTNRTSAVIQSAMAGFSFGGVWGAAAGAIYGWIAAGREQAEVAHMMRMRIQDLWDSLDDLTGGMQNWQQVAAMVGLEIDQHVLRYGSLEDRIAHLTDLHKELSERLREVNADFQPLLQSAIDFGRQLPRDLEDAIGRLIEMGVLTGETARLFEQLTGQGEVNWKKMQEAAERYGVELSSLGPQFQSARLHESAQTIWDDFQLLVSSGADVGGVLFGMREEISQLVLDSIKFGTTIPENFRPLIEELIRSGNLLDENGNALKDMPMVEFSDPIVSGFDRIVQKLEELIAQLRGPLQDAIASIPTDIDVNVNGRYHPPDIPTYDDEQRGENEGFATGTLGRFGQLFHDFGTERTVNVHGVESIQTPAQLAGVVAAARGGDSEAVTALLRRHERMQRDLPRRIAVAVDDALSKRRAA